ncbi:MAG TPA: nucleotidyltransferase domain-containing protein [Candidatus Hydrogenedentes bacterium]|nr:nucleotidyltransferase domain-containing protein [Candidatus Hydrogenedentota bacterium]
MSAEEIVATLRELNGEMERDFKAVVQGIFGSRARGDDRDDSDLDVLVEFREKATIYDLVGLGDFLEEKFHCKVDVVSKRALSEKLKPHIMKELVRV